MVFFRIILLIGIILSTFVSNSQIRTAFTYDIKLDNRNEHFHTCYDVTYYHLVIKPDFIREQITGSVSITFQLIFKSDSIRIDLDTNFQINSINITGGLSIPFTRTDQQILIPTNCLYSKDLFHNSITIEYSGSSRGTNLAPWDSGIIWDKDSKGAPFVGVSCQLEGAKTWWPCKDVWNDKPDSVEIVLIVPQLLSAISNGILRVKRELDTSIEYTWFEEYPILPYNVTFYIGRYVEIKDYLFYDKDSVPLIYFVLEENIEKARQHFQQIKQMVTVYQDLFGKFPFYKTGLKIVEAPYLGMEHQTAIGYGNKFNDGQSGFDFSGIGLKEDYVLLHEIPHEWWGNSVSANAKNDIWINESLATYSESLYIESLHGLDTALLYINFDRANTFQNKYPLYDTIVGSVYSIDMYFKGSAIWNTLRTVVDNDSLWFSFFKSIQKDFKFNTISTAELIQYINNYFQNDYTVFFQQYIYNNSIPILEMKRDSIDPEILSYRWKSCVNGFEMPLIYHDKQETFIMNPGNDWTSQKIPINDFDLVPYLSFRYLINVVGTKLEPGNIFPVFLQLYDSKTSK